MFSPGKCTCWSGVGARCAPPQSTHVCCACWVLLEATMLLPSRPTVNGTSISSCLEQLAPVQIAMQHALKYFQHPGIEAHDCKTAGIIPLAALCKRRVVDDLM